ncbi:MAG: hypothetical protein ACRDJH_11535 [Thermomicrobiales bacterium]
MSKRPRPGADRDVAPPAPQVWGETDEGASSSTVSPRERGGEAVAGLVGGEATRGGEDVRRRGWFWHWNSVVTQYAPLIGLKGVGLLNSYTVWTDRREESPHRGYAFPSQQREADFYGEDRAELITINKILVALDLIEIRKEMVLRADEQGRRWRVPHNFYRVKDHDDGFTLNADAVLRVVELADRDKTVYRFIRRIFSPRFAPIDADNVWHRILPVVRAHEIWQRLAARAAHEDDRASARTRRGHAARKAGLGLPNDGDSATPATTANDSDAGETGVGSQTSVATTNRGLAPDVASINIGFDDESTTVVDATNSAPPTAVAPSNTTYHQDDLTTTTTTPRTQKDEQSQDVTGGGRVARGVTARTAPVSIAVPVHAGPGGQPAPVDVVGEAAAIRAFEDANGRKSTPAERHLLRGLAERVEPAARTTARPGLEDGWSWLVAAVYEAVEAGSAYVAPRRLREILTRWERDGLPEAGGGRRKTEDGRRQSPALGTGHSALVGEGPELSLPHGFGSRRTWEFTVGLLATALDRDRLAELVAGTWIAGYREGEVTVAAPDPVQSERLAGEYRPLIERKLGEAMRRPVRLAVLTDEAEGGETVAVDRVEPVEPGMDEEEPVAPVFLVAECGLPSGQVWSAVLEEAARGGEISRANVDAWLRSTALIGRGEDGALIVGAPHSLAQRRVATRFLPPLRAAVAAVIGASLPVEVVVTRDWLLLGDRSAAARPPAAEHQRGA